jgi:hypothetical protein
MSNKKIGVHWSTVHKYLNKIKQLGTEEQIEFLGANE